MRNLIRYSEHFGKISGIALCFFLIFGLTSCNDSAENSPQGLAEKLISMESGQHNVQYYSKFDTGVSEEHYSNVVFDKKNYFLETKSVSPLANQNKASYMEMSFTETDGILQQKINTGEISSKEYTVDEFLNIKIKNEDLLKEPPMERTTPKELVADMKEYIGEIGLASIGELIKANADSFKESTSASTSGHTAYVGYFTPDSMVDSFIKYLRKRAVMDAKFRDPTATFAEKPTIEEAREEMRRTYGGIGLTFGIYDTALADSNIPVTILFPKKKDGKIFIIASTAQAVNESNAKRENNANAQHLQKASITYCIL